MSTAVIASAVARMESLGIASEAILAVVKDMLAAGNDAPDTAKSPSSAALRQRRYRDNKASQTVTRDVTRDVTQTVTRDVTVTPCDVTSDAPSCVGALAEPELTNLENNTKTRKKERTPKRVTYPSDFEFLVGEYRETDRTVKLEAFKVWNDLTDEDRDLCLDSLGPFEQILERERQRGFERTKPGLQVYIRQRRWEAILEQRAA